MSNTVSLGLWVRVSDGLLLLFFFVGRGKFRIVLPQPVIHPTCQKMTFRITPVVSVLDATGAWPSVHISLIRIETVLLYRRLEKGAPTKANLNPLMTNLKHTQATNVKTHDLSAVGLHLGKAKWVLLYHLVFSSAGPPMWLLHHAEKDTIGQTKMTLPYHSGDPNPKLITGAPKHHQITMMLNLPFLVPPGVAERLSVSDTCRRDVMM